MNLTDLRDVLDQRSADPGDRVAAHHLRLSAVRTRVAGRRRRRAAVGAACAANWLLYGVQPDGAKPGLTPGRCTGKVHQRATLGFTGRRVLVTRQWSGKTLTDHRADNRAWVRAVLAGGLADIDEHEQADTDPGGKPRYRFELARPEDPDVLPLEHRVLRAVSVRIRWRADLDAARRRAAGGVSATATHLTSAA
jgi:hypothetical protein